MHKKKSGKVLEQTSCPNCTSSDAYTIYQQDNGSLDATCFSCGYYTTNPYKGASELDSVTDTGSLSRPAKNSMSGHASSTREQLTLQDCESHPIRGLPDRLISQATCEKYGVRVGVDTRNGVTPIYHLYPYYDEDGDLTGYKKRDVSTKTFTSIGHVKSNQLFGLNTIKPKGNKLFITEGEIDALSLYQVLKEGSAFDWEPAVISLPHGVKSAIKSISENLDIINGYENVIVVFDSDTPGKEATKEVCKMLAGKAFTTKLTEKDPNDMLLAGKGSDLKWSVLTSARKYQPDGIVNAKDLWSRYKEESQVNCYPYPDTMSGLNDKTYGIRPGTIVTVTAGSGSGKTAFLRELKYHYWRTTDFKIADIALEESVSDTLGGLLSLHLNKRISLPDVKVEEDVEKTAYEELFSDGRFTLYDYFGGMDDDNLFSKLRYFAANGHRLIFLDHLSIIVSEYASEGGERERIDTIMTKLAKLVKETNITIFLVVHLKKSDSSKHTFEQGAVPSLDDLRGSGSIKQLSWDVIGLSRNQQHPNSICANTSELHVLKCRFTGRTGKAGYIYFDDKSGRMVQASEPLGYYLV